MSGERRWASRSCVAQPSHAPEQHPLEDNGLAAPTLRSICSASWTNPSRRVEAHPEYAYLQRSGNSG